jgi:hypothetical protein
MGVSKSLIDNVLRDLRYASRSLLRAPLVALTVVTTVGLGLGLVAVVFTIMNAYLFQADEVRNPHEIFAVERQPSVDGAPQGFTRLDYDDLMRDTAIFAAAFASSTGSADAYIEGTRREGVLVTGNFFTVLGARWQRRSSGRRSRGSARSAAVIRDRSPSTSSGGSPQG